jgi:hypothetical protein
MYTAGQVLQDTVDTGARQIRLLSKEKDGRWLTQTIVDRLGGPVENGRRTRVSETTLTTSYAPVAI